MKQVIKKFSEENQAYVGMEPSKKQPNKMRMTPQHIHTIPTSCAILSTVLCVCCVHRRVVEGSGEGSGGSVVHVDVHGMCYIVGGCNVVATGHGRYSPVLYAETVSSTYDMLGVFTL